MVQRFCKRSPSDLTSQVTCLVDSNVIRRKMLRESGKTVRALNNVMYQIVNALDEAVNLIDAIMDCVRVL